jgi:hypothetical protein
MKEYERLIAEAEEIATSVGLKNIIISLPENPNPAEQFASGEVLVLQKASDYFGNGNDLRTTLLNPSWADVLRAADRVPETTEDFHHIYLERVNFDGKTVSFYFGS